MLRLEVRKLCCGKVFWKCPYLSDLEPAFKATNGMMFLWSAIDNSWYLCDATGKPHGSCNAQLLRWGYEKLNLPSGKVLVPANCINGDPKFTVLSTHEMEQWVKKKSLSLSRQQLGLLLLLRAKPRFQNLLHHPGLLVRLSRLASWSLGGLWHMDLALVQLWPLMVPLNHLSPLCHHLGIHQNQQNQQYVQDKDGWWKQRSWLLLTTGLSGENLKPCVLSNLEILACY